MRLTIKDFSVLKDVDINLDDVTVIIGEQASGKSLTARVLFFALEAVLSNSLSSLFESYNTDSHEALNSKDPLDEIRKQFVEFFPESFWGNSNCFIEFRGDQKEDTVKINNSTEGLIFSYPKIQVGYNEKLNKIFDLLKNSGAEPRVLFNVINYLNSRDINTNKNLIYIPAGRSFFSFVKDNIFRLISSDNFVIDPILKEFGQDYNKVKSRLVKINHMASYEFEQLTKKIIKGQWHLDNGFEVIKLNGKEIPVENASSGQQEALPLVLMLKNELLAAKESPGQKTIVIEEPEAHLFPASQRAIVDLIFQVKRQCPHVKFLITTHSPYILTCINNEIMKAKRDKVTVGVDSYFMADGVSTRIFDDETGLINGEKLDEISGEIADEFYALLENEA